MRGSSIVAFLQQAEANLALISSQLEDGSNGRGLSRIRRRCAKPSSNSEAEQEVTEFETEVKEQLAVQARTLLGFERRLQKLEQSPSVRTEKESADEALSSTDWHKGLQSVADELRREIQERCDATEQRFRDFCRRHMSAEQQAPSHTEPAAKDDAAEAKVRDDVSQRHSPRPTEADARAALPASAKSAEAAFCGSPGTPIGVQDPAALRSTTPRSGRSPRSFHFPSPCHINMSAVAARDFQDVFPSAAAAPSVRQKPLFAPESRPEPEPQTALPELPQQVQEDFPGTSTCPAGAPAVEAEGSMPFREDSEASSQGIMSLPLEDLGLQSEDLASQRERGSGFSVNDDHAFPSGASVYAGIPPLPLKRNNAPPAAPATREESARSSLRSSVSSFAAASIEEIGMEPVARDTSYGRALSAEMAPATVKQTSAEAAQAGSWPTAEPVTREKKDAREESARSSLRSSVVSSFAAESIEEIGMEPVARDTSYGRALSAEMAPPTAKQTSAEAAQAGSWPAAELVTREKRDTREESARSSLRSSLSSSVSESIEEIGMEPVARDTSYGRALSAETAPPTVKQTSAEAAQAGSWPAAEPVTREKKDDKEESAAGRSSRRSSVSSSVAESIEEIGMEPVAWDTSYGRALSAETAPPVKQTSAEAAQDGSWPAAEPVTREKKDTREESARSSLRSSVSSFAAGWIEEISMEPVARDTSYGRALSAEMALPTANQNSAEAAQAGSWPAAEPVTREKKDGKEESAAGRSSRRSSMSNSVAESIEEIGMEPVPHQGYQHLPRAGSSQEPRVLSGVFADDLEEISVEPVFATERVSQTQHHPSSSDRTLGAEIAPSTKQDSAEAHASSLATAAPATMEKKDEKEGAAMMSHRSSASSSVADAIEEISMKPEPATNRMASDLLESRQAESNGPLFVTQASGASTLESVDAGLDRSQQGRADGGGISSRQEALAARSCSHSSSGASSTNMKCPKPEPAPRKQAAPGGCAPKSDGDSSYTYEEDEEESPDEDESSEPDAVVALEHMDSSSGSSSGRRSQRPGQSRILDTE